MSDDSYNDAVFVMLKQDLTTSHQLQLHYSLIIAKLMAIVNQWTSLVTASAWN